VGSDCVSCGPFARHALDYTALAHCLARRTRPSEKEHCETIEHCGNLPYENSSRSNSSIPFALYIFLLPTIVFFVVFHYVPIYGLQIAFKNYVIMKGIWGSAWVGLQNFADVFALGSFWEVLRNTVLISFYKIVFGFPAPIILAILLSELVSTRFKKAAQTISYLPHFVSWVVLGGLFRQFLSPSMGLQSPEWFRPIYISSGIWQSMGWSSIIYYASLRAINPSLYEAAAIDGANRKQKILSISLPGILPTIITLLLLNLGNLLTVGFEKVFLLYNPSTYETADVLSTYVYRSGLVGQQYSFAAAVGLFNSAVTLILLIVFNYAAKKASGQSLW